MKYLKFKMNFENLTPTLVDCLLEDRRPLNRFFEKVYRWIDCIFFIFILDLISSIIKIKIFEKQFLAYRHVLENREDLWVLRIFNDLSISTHWKRLRLRVIQISPRLSRTEW